MSKRYSFGVVGYPDREHAEEALDIVNTLAGEKRVKLADAAIVVKADDGKLELHQTHEISVGTGAITGGVAGLLLGFALGGPLGGALVGLLGGGALGVFDTGIENKRMKKLGESLAPGHTALCVLIEDADWQLLRERLAPLGGEVLVAELTDEAAEALERSAGTAAPE